MNKHTVKIFSIAAAVVGFFMVATSAEPFKPSTDSTTSQLLAIPEIFPSDTAQIRGWSAPMLPTAEMLDEAEMMLEDEELSVYDILANEMNDYAAKYLGIRYRLGATGPKAFDCSGFTQNIFRNFGMELNRTARTQYKQGDKVDLDDVKPGDLLFFSGRRVSKNVGHVAMVTKVDEKTGELEFIHASSSKGIAYQKFPDNGYYSRRFLGARRILGSDGFEADNYLSKS